jgi:hypothetical protein
METTELLIQQQEQIVDITEGKKETIESAKFSAETTFKDANLKETFGRTLGGILGVLVLFGSITNVIQDFKIKKRNPWIYSRIILDFTASGALIGYALENTLWGLKLGVAVGLIILMVEMICLRNK